MAITTRRFRRRLLSGIGVVVAMVAIATIALWPGGVVRTTASGLLQYRGCFVSGPESGALVAVGDSVTAGHHIPWMNMRSTDSYADILACDGEPVANEGVKGQTSAQVLDRFDSDALAASPTHIIVTVGTNDLRLGLSDETIDNLDEMRAMSVDAGVGFTVGLIPPSDLAPVETVELNETILAWAEEKGVAVLDFWTPLAADDGTYREGMSPDGIHPSETGAEAMVDVVRSANLVP